MHEEIYKRRVLLNEYMSYKTGEIVTGIRAVIKTAWIDLKYYHIINLRWGKFPPYFFEG